MNFFALLIFAWSDHRSMHIIAMPNCTPFFRIFKINIWLWVLSNIRKKNSLFNYPEKLYITQKLNFFLTFLRSEVDASVYNWASTNSKFFKLLYLSLVYSATELLIRLPFKIQSDQKSFY